MRIISLLVGFLLIAAVGVFADTSVIIPGAPEWLNSLLATLGLAGVGGVGVFAVIARKIASVEAKYLPIVQALKSTIDKDANLFSTLKATIKDGPLVGDWNDAMSSNASFLSHFPIHGISDKADIFNRLVINLPKEPAILQKAELVAEKVVKVIDAIPEPAASAPAQA